MDSATKHRTISCLLAAGSAAAWLAGASSKADGLNPVPAVAPAAYLAEVDPGRPIELSLFLYGLLLFSLVSFAWLFGLMLRSQAEERAQARREREQGGGMRGKVNAFRLRPGRPIEWPEAPVHARKPRLRLAALGQLRRRNGHR